MSATYREGRLPITLVDDAPDKAETENPKPRCRVSIPLRALLALLRWRSTEEARPEPRADANAAWPWSSTTSPTSNGPLSKLLRVGVRTAERRTSRCSTSYLVRARSPKVLNGPGRLVAFAVDSSWSGRSSWPGWSTPERIASRITCGRSTSCPERSRCVRLGHRDDDLGPGVFGLDVADRRRGVGEWVGPLDGRA